MNFHSKYSFLKLFVKTGHFSNFHRFFRRGQDVSESHREFRELTTSCTKIQDLDKSIENFHIGQNLKSTTVAMEELSLRGEYFPY